jgi:paraquat-inducible protein A
MLEVLLVGGFVAYTRIQTVATIEIGVGGWCMIAATFATMFALTQLDDRTIWESLPGSFPDGAVRQAPGSSDAQECAQHEPHDGAVPRMPGSSDARREPHPRPEPEVVVACTACDLIVPVSAAVAAHAARPACPRCRARLHTRKPDAGRRTAAFLIAAYLLYIPANLLPVTALDGVGGVEEHTIMSGVFELIDNDLMPLAVIVFVASVVLPLLKILSLTWMLICVRLRSARLIRIRTRLYRGIEAIGRWSNIDVFMGSVLVALLQFGALTTVRAQPGLVAFAAVVVLTMIATETFDSRLMWDAAAENAR